jgi:hypothetical protein
LPDTDEELTVDVSDALVHLDTKGRPEIGAERLVSGMLVQVAGTEVQGDEGPLFEAERVRVRHGRLHRATISSTSPMEARFTTEGGDIKRTFGELVSEGPLGVEIAPGAVFRGPVTSEAQLFELFDALGAGRIEVEVRGIGAGSRNEIRAYEIFARSLHGPGQR